MKRFATLVQGIAVKEENFFANELARLVNDGWEIVNSGCTQGMFWAILSEEY